MLGLLTEPFESHLVRQALTAGVVASLICAIVGTWVVLRGAAFLGEAMAHGVLPGVALATALGGNIVFGAMVAALAMAYGVSTLGSSTRLSPDTSIGLLLVGMLALGVIVVSYSRSFATDLTALLFGDVLAATTGDILGLTAALAVIAAVAFVGRRAFVAASFDVRKAATLGLRPTMAVAALTVLIAMAIVASFQVVGTLLMLGLLVAPPAAALVWGRSVPQIMAGAAVFGVMSVVLGLVVSWHAGTAGGATIAITAVGLFFISLTVKVASARLRPVGVAATALTFGLAGCAAEPQPAAPAPHGDEYNVTSADVEELTDAPTRLIIVDSESGATEVIDALDESGVAVGEFGPVRDLVGDGRFGYLLGDAGVTVVDSGAWTFDHGDHNHYYATPPSSPGSHAFSAEGVSVADNRVALQAGDQLSLLDRKALADGEISAESRDAEGTRVAVPYHDDLIIATETGELQSVSDEGVVTVLPVRCEDAGGATATRTAVVLTCRDGAVRISADGPSVIPFPADQRPVLGPLKNRGREGTLVGLAGEQVWVLDSAERTWTSVRAPGVVAANSAGDGQVLALTADGVLRLFDAPSGAQTAELTLFTAAIATAPTIDVDSDRAYLNDAAAQAVYEIDYRDGLRLARTLRTSVTPDLMVETGR